MLCYLEIKYNKILLCCFGSYACDRLLGPNGKKRDHMDKTQSVIQVDQKSR